MRPLKWLVRVPDDELCVSHCIPNVSHENYMLYTLHCAAARAVRTCAVLPPTHPVTINLYHFKDSVAHRPPLLHPDSQLQLSVPLRLHRHRRLRGVGNPASAEPSPLRWGSAHFMGPLVFSMASGHRAFFQDWTCRKTVFPTFVRPM